MRKRAGLAWARAGVPVACFAAFVYIALAAGSGWPSPLPPDAFLRIDPLVWAVGSLASRSLAPYWLTALALVAVTAILGRVFCGWVCPLGAAADGVRRLRKRSGSVKLTGWALRARFWVLAGLLAAGVAGANFAVWLDPLVVSSRALHVGRGAGCEPVGAAVAWALVAVAIGLALLAPRLWCRVVCPLGAALSLVARLAPYRRRTTAACTHCGACTAACPIGEPPGEGSPARCIGCRRCQAACGEGGIAFAFARPSARAAGAAGGRLRGGLSRRGLVGVLAALLLGGAAGLLVRRRPRGWLLRPPGAVREEEFVARCVGCATCVGVCPTGGLLPVVRWGRPDAAFTPHLVPRVGGCLPRCTACGEVCPTGAIARVSLDEKPSMRIGLAVIDHSRCLPWARNERCLICYDACPREYRAIKLRPVGTGVPRPHVDELGCVGCGVCVRECPEDAVAIAPRPGASRAL